jgi:hypothetical protein
MHLKKYYKKHQLNIEEVILKLSQPATYLVCSGTLIARRQVRQTYHLHGLGRHTLEEQQRFAEKDMKAIADTVAANHFIA